MFVGGERFTQAEMAGFNLYSRTHKPMGMKANKKGQLLPMSQQSKTIREGYQNAQTIGLERYIMNILIS